MADPIEDNNPIKYHLHGVPIRKTNTITLRVDEEAYVDLVKQSKTTGISISKIYAFRNAPCESCGCDNVTIVLLKRKQTYRIGENGGSLVRNHGKGQENTNEDHSAQ